MASEFPAAAPVSCSCSPRGLSGSAALGRPPNRQRPVAVPSALFSGAALTKKGPPVGDPVCCERVWLRSVIHAAHTAHSTAARHRRSALLLGSLGDHCFRRDEQPGNRSRTL